MLDFRVSNCRPLALQVYYSNADVRQVDVPSYSGNFGILANHVPTLAVIKPGVVTVYEGDGTKKFFGNLHRNSLTWHH